jgi:glucosamine--fructose-6-phosphate aminotransferase (isomerizing)
VDSVERYLSKLREHVEEAQACLQNTHHLILAGRGSSLASACTGGLIVKEAARFHAEGMSAAAFRHGPLEMVNRGLFLLVFEGAERTAGLNRKLVSDVVEIGDRPSSCRTGTATRYFRYQRSAKLYSPYSRFSPSR